MFRRRQPALIASLATAASVGLIAPAAAISVPVQGASAVSQAAVARGVVPAVASAAVVADATLALAAVAGEASDDAPEEQPAEPASEPASEPIEEPESTTTTVPAEEPAESSTTTVVPVEEPAGEPATDVPPTTTTPSTTEPAEPTESTTTEPTGTSTTTPEGDEEPADEPAAEPAPPTTTPADAGDPACESADDPTPTTTTTTTTTTTLPAEDPVEPVCEPTVDPTTTTTIAPPAEETDTSTTVAPTTETTAPATVPAPVDEPVDEPGDDDGDDDGEAEETNPPASEDESPEVATATAPAERAETATKIDHAEGSDAPATTVPVDTTPAELNTYDPGLRASSYDGVYAEGVPVGVAMATTRWLESGNRYDAQARGSTASGAYQVINSTWNGYDGYARAVLAPPEVQDQFAYESFTALLKRHGNDVSKIPVSWYIGHVPQGAEWDTVPHPEAGNTLTPRQYQAKWMKKFFSLLSEGAPVYLPSDTEALVPAIAFPVLGPVEFVDDWHFERDGGARQHEGLDLIGYEGQPIRAAFDGVITMIDDDPSGIAGNGLRLTRDDGLYANYFHLSNSETGPVHSSLEVGTRVRAGQIIGFMGTTGNAGIPHLHFELRTPEREPMAPYPAMLEAIQREQCTVGLGPWSTEFMSPAEQAEAEAEALKALAELTDEQIEGLAHLPEAPADEVEYLTIEGPDGAQWVIGDDGSVTATGQAAMIGSYQADCPMPIDTVDENGDPIVYGTDADGLAVDELPIGWWDDEAVEWKPDLEAEETYVDPWELDQADLDGAHEHHVDHSDVNDGLVDRRFLRMI